MNMEDVLGKDFAEKYNSKPKGPIKTKKSVLEAIINEINEQKFDPELGSMKIPDGKYFYEVLLMEVPADTVAKDTRNPELKRVGLKWKGRWVTTFLNEKELKKIEPGKTYFIVGNTKTGEWNGKPTVTLFGKNVITLEEVAEKVLKDQDVRE